MAHPKLSVPKSRAVALAGVTAVVLSSLSTPLMSALAYPHRDQPGLSYRIERRLAVLDPVTGLLIHPITGLVINLTDVVYDTAIGEYVDPTTGAIVPTDGSIPGLTASPPEDIQPPDSAADGTARMVGGGLHSPAVGDSTNPVPDSVPQQSVAPSSPAPPQESPQVVADAGPGFISTDASPRRLVTGNDSSPAKMIRSVVDLVLDGSEPFNADEPAETG
ncbi:MAG: hypothetical protein ACRDZO_07165 [Egibacteraceae bacterium]